MNESLGHFHPLDKGKDFDTVQRANLDKLNHKNPEWQALKGRENRMVVGLGSEPVQPIEPLQSSTIVVTEVFNGRGDIVGHDTIAEVPQIFPYITGESYKGK